MMHFYRIEAKMSTKYVRCSGCGRKIYIGEEAIMSSREIFCDVHCFASFYGEYTEQLTDAEALMRTTEIFDELEERRQLAKEIERLQRELLCKQIELGTFTTIKK